MKKVLLYIIAIGVCTVAVAAAGLAAYTQTAGFRAWLKDILVAEARLLIDGEITVGSLEGNLFNRLELNDMVLTQADAPVIRIDRLAVSYDPLALLSQQIAIQQLTLEAPELTLKMQEDRALNLATVYRSTDAADDTTAVSGWSVPQTRLELRNGTIVLEDLKSEDDRIPERVEDINLDLIFAYQDSLSLSVEALEFATRNPDVRIEAPLTEIGVAEMSVSSESLSIRTSASLIRADLSFTDPQQTDFAVSLSAQPLAFDDLRRFVPDLPVYGQTDLQIDVNGTLDDLAAIIVVDGDQGLLEVNAQLNLNATPIGYRVSGRIRRGDPAPLLRQKALKSNLNMDFEVSGEGNVWGDIVGEATIGNRRSNVMGYVLDTSALHIMVYRDSLVLDGILTSDAASTRIEGEVVLRDSLPRYKASGDFQNIDLARWMPDGGVPSNLSGQYRISGRGVDMADASGGVSLMLSPSHVDSIPIDSLHIAADIAPHLINLNEFQITSPVAFFEVQGNWTPDAALEGAFQLELKDPAPFAAAAALDTLAGTGRFSGVVEGRLDSLVFDTSFTVDRLTVPDAVISRLEGSVAGRRTDSGLAWRLESDIRDVRVGEQDSIDTEISLAFTDSLYDFDIRVKHPDMAFDTAGQLGMQETVSRAVLRRLGLTYAGMRWTGGALAEIEYDGTTVRFSDLALTSAGQTIALSGYADTTGAGQTRIRVDSLSLATIQTLGGIQDSSYAGVLDAAITIAGPFSGPDLDGWYQLTQGRYQQEPIDEMSGNLSLTDNRLLWRMRIAGLGQDSLFTLAGYLPAEVSLSPFVFAVPDDDSLDLSLRMADLDLAIANGMVDDITEIRGRLSADFRIYNTFRDLFGSGRFNIAGGAWSMPLLGTKYRNARLGVTLQNNEVRLDTLSIDVGNQGKISVSDGSMALSQQSVDRFNARLNVRRFPLMNNRRMRAILDGQLTMSGTIREPVISGVLNVPDARIYYPAWMAEDNAVILKDRPFFVIEDTVVTRPSGATRFQQAAPVERPFTETDLYRNLRGEITLNFNRNVWLRSEEARIEIEGTVRVQKTTEEDFVLFGTLSTVRGYYELQGNRFHIVEGQFTFKGDPEINPAIHLEAVYTYREQNGNDATRHEIRIIITGDSLVPQFAFLLDGEPAEQQDIFSLLLFGKTFNNLSIGQQNRIAESTSGQNAATRFVSGQVIRRIARQLEQQLKLDMLQIDQSSSGLRGARVQAGKYLTPGIFVSVSQDFGNEGDQRVELEYKIPRSFLFLDLFLRALRERTGNSGVDLIWKLEW